MKRVSLCWADNASQTFVTFFCWKLWEMIWVISETKISYFKLRISKNPVGWVLMHILRMIYTPPPLLFLDIGDKKQGAKLNTFICLKIWFPSSLFVSNFHTIQRWWLAQCVREKGEKSGFAVAPWPLTCEHLTLRSSSDHYCIRGKKNWWRLLTLLLEFCMP